jgi:hypothetical protein
MSVPATVPHTRLALLLGAAAAVVCGPGARLDAQTVQFRSQAGLSLPTRISIHGGELHVQQKIGVTMGARMTLTFNPRFDVVTGVSYTPGYAIIRGAGKGFQVSTGAHLLAATSGARYWLVPKTRPLSWEIHTGVGLAAGGRPAYEDLLAVSRLSGIVGTSLRYRLGRIVSLQLAVQERLYQVRLGNRAPLSSSRPLRMSFGLGLPFLESLPW